MRRQNAINRDPNVRQTLKLGPLHKDPCLGDCWTYPTCRSLAVGHTGESTRQSQSSFGTVNIVYIQPIITVQHFTCEKSLLGVTSNPSIILPSNFTWCMPPPLPSE